ncbi:uncharacterized protein L3040_006243 [Drepanopeziza brunnea f. sp. 'multigermtubi']|uniref:uncharacterized protein n=1 Tax=Drepanopeziza brunnea f. sp. 'multigermtubi' TaxID=698441 RepID=UPI0023896397|nr:hypothetical protein L3040_006243 [Drepanopeziza brunnea f. sp. 'multigermtubi']
MADSIDPQLRDTSRSTPPPRRAAVPLPLRGSNGEEQNSGSDGECNEGAEKRRKLNLWKCKPCREARKKCFPEDRVWPQKCQRCLQHRPDQLECSEPELNTRTRGKNLSKPARRSKPRSTPDRSDLKRVASDDDESSGSEVVVFDRPARTNPLKRVKRERQGTLMQPMKEASEPTSAARKDQPPPSLYLPLGEDAFRILRLEGGRKDDKLRCTFEIASIARPPKYEAVSYLWAGNSETQLEYEVELLDNQQPAKTHRRPLKPNLHSALRSLRHPTAARLFWIDALCINHTNVEEKSQQVAMKRFIFYKAENLCFWLGDEPVYKSALNFIPQILELNNVDKLVQDEEAVEKWAAFLNLLKNRVFSRLWLVQEVAIARNVTLHCGAPAIHYADFVDAVTIFLSCRKHISVLFRNKKKDARELTDRKITMVERFIDVTTNALRRTSKTDHVEGVQRLLSLEALVSELSDLSSGDPRDRIYSVLALAKDGPPLLDTGNSHALNEALRIDYARTTLDVYQDFFAHAVTTSQSLDILCRRWASSIPEKEAQLPTWIRPLQSNLQAPFDPNVSERTDADSLVGIPDHHCYNATKNTTASFRISSSSPSAPRSLFVRGHRLDAIARLGPRASEGIILYEWLQLGHCTISDEIDTVPEPFWRTLVADRGPLGTNAPSWYHRAFLYCLAESTPNGDINTNRLIAACEAGSSSLVVDFLQRVQAVIWNRKFLVSRERGWIGLAPMAAVEGDAVVVLKGCSVPVVLRREEGERDGDCWWKCVGECYVHGIMEGEALEMGFLEEEFEIR